MSTISQNLEASPTTRKLLRSVPGLVEYSADSIKRQADEISERFAQSALNFNSDHSDIKLHVSKVYTMHYGHEVSSNSRKEWVTHGGTMAFTISGVDLTDKGELKGVMKEIRKYFEGKRKMHTSIFAFKDSIAIGNYSVTGENEITARFVVANTRKVNARWIPVADS